MSERCCLFCHKPLIRAPGEKPSELTKRIYCNHRCATSHHRVLATARVGPRNCRYCDKPLVRRPNEQIQSFRRRKNCVPHCRKPVPKIRTPQPRKPPRFIARPKPAPVVVTPLASADMIAAYILHYGVTRCPTAAVEVTTATMPAADRHTLRQYREAMEQQWINKSMKQRRKGF